MKIVINSDGHDVSLRERAKVAFKILIGRGTYIFCDKGGYFKGNVELQG